MDVRNAEDEHCLLPRIITHPSTYASQGRRQVTLKRERNAPITARWRAVCHGSALLLPDWWPSDSSGEYRENGADADGRTSSPPSHTLDAQLDPPPTFSWARSHPLAQLVGAPSMKPKRPGPQPATDDTGVRLAGSRQAREQQRRPTQFRGDGHWLP